MAQWKGRMGFHPQKLKSNRIFQHVVAQIEAAIIAGDLKPGDVLPSEMKLKEMFETSRGTIREAFRVLEEKGLVDIRTGVGGGAVVRSMDADKISAQLSLYVQTQQVSFDQIAEFREGVEGVVTALAARRATPADVRRLTDILDRAREIIEKAEPDWQSFIRLDMAFHVAVSEIAANPIHIAVHKMVHDQIMGHNTRFSQYLSNAENLRESYRDLCDIAEAVAAGDTARAGLDAQMHVRRSLRRMRDAAASQEENGSRGASAHPPSPPTVRTG